MTSTCYWGIFQTVVHTCVCTPAYLKCPSSIMICVRNGNELSDVSVLIRNLEWSAKLWNYICKHVDNFNVVVLMTSLTKRTLHVYWYLFWIVSWKECVTCQTKLYSTYRMDVMLLRRALATLGGGGRGTLNFHLALKLRWPYCRSKKFRFLLKSDML